MQKQYNLPNDSDNFLTDEGIRFLKNINLHQKIDKHIAR